MAMFRGTDCCGLVVTRSDDLIAEVYVMNCKHGRPLFQG